MTFLRPHQIVSFDPANWYWVVAGDTTQVYSSAVVNYVPVADAAYQAWLTVPGHVPSRVATEQELWDYLAYKNIEIPAAATTSDSSKTQRIISEMNEVIGQILFNHENRLRVLQGQATITKAQFITGVKSLLK